MKLRRCILFAFAGALSLSACGDRVRSQILIVGSSTVYPFSTAVAERFARTGDGAFKAPVIEQNGTGAGIKLFCAGVGGKTPDIVNASRRIKPSELADCRAHGVTRVVEIPIGIDGLVLIEANDGPRLTLTPVDIYKALAADPFGRPNTTRTWRDVDPALPAISIQVYGPPPTSGTRDAFAELILERGCDTAPAMKALKERDKDAHKIVCTKVREDNVFIEAGENDNLLVQKVEANPGTLGIMGYSFLEQNLDRVHGLPLSGVAPTYASIAAFDYPGARPLFIYVKGEHLNVIPGIREYVAAFAAAFGDGGSLVRRGLIALPADRQAAARAATLELRALDPASLS